MMGRPLSGKRVLLRRFVEADITEAYLGWLNDPCVTRFSNQRFRTHDRDTSMAYLASFIDSPNMFLSVRRLSDDMAIGTMTAYRVPVHGTVDVGIMIGEASARGGGWGSDAWSTLTTALLADPAIRKLTAGCAAQNVAMVRLMERSGMTHEATRRGQEIINDRPADLVYYARFADHRS